MTILDKHKRFREVFKSNEDYVKNKNHPAQCVVVIVSSNATLALVLQNLKKSIWWNHEAHVMIVNNDAENSCYKAQTLLKTVWTFNILSVIYLCRRVDNQLILYTFNPYSHLAPTFWNKVKKDKFTDESWTLLEHPIKHSYEYLFSYGE